MFCFSFSTQKLQHLQHQIDKLKEENFTLETCKYEQKTVAHYFLKCFFVNVYMTSLQPWLERKTKYCLKVLFGAEAVNFVVLCTGQTLGCAFNADLRPTSFSSWVNCVAHQCTVYSCA